MIGEQGHDLHGGDVLHDVLLELGAVGARLGELVDVMAGEFLAVPRVIWLSATDNPVDWKVEIPQNFHAVKIDNPNAVTVEVAFSSGNAASAAGARSDERVPAHTGRVITRPFDVVSIGIDPAVVPGGRSPVFVTFYARPLPPTTYAFAP